MKNQIVDYWNTFEELKQDFTKINTDLTELNSKLEEDILLTSPVGKYNENFSYDIGLQIKSLIGTENVCFMVFGFLLHFFKYLPFHRKMDHISLNSSSIQMKNMCGPSLLLLSSPT